MRLSRKQKIIIEFAGEVLVVVLIFTLCFALLFFV